MVNFPACHGTGLSRSYAQSSLTLLPPKPWHSRTVPKVVETRTVTEV